MYPVVRLRKGKEAAVGHGHPWVFSGAIDHIDPAAATGDLVLVLDSSGDRLGVGSFSRVSSIAVRMMARGEVRIDRDWLARSIEAAAARRVMAGFGRGTAPAGYRVVFGEADGIPGLVLDRYGDVAVLQLSTAGADRLRQEIGEAVVEALGVSVVIERSDGPARHEEGLEPVNGVLHGEAPREVRFEEDGSTFLARPLTGQKTGFYLDQRDLRSAVRRYAAGRRVLNLFSYTGAFAIATIRGGAKEVTNVDSSAEALAGAVEHAALNGIAPEAVPGIEADVFPWLGSHPAGGYGMVILDPPALVKARKDADAGRRAYHFLNRAALRLVDDGGVFATSSCSHHLAREDLEFILRRASLQAGVRLHVLETPGQPADHPTSLYFPEATYLKSFVCLVERCS